MSEKRGQFNVFEYRWLVTHQKDDHESTKAFYKELLAQEFARKIKGKLTVASWQVRGTIVRDGKKLRLKPVFDNYQDALEAAANLRAEAEKTTRVAVRDLLPAAKAKDAITADLPEGWTFKGTVAFSKKMGYNPNLPQVSVEFAINDYLGWLSKQVEAGNKSQVNYDNQAFFLKLVRLYFKQQPVYVLLDKVRVQHFCEGTDPIPCGAEPEKSRKIPRDHTTESKRPWGRDTQRGVAAAISAMMNGYVRGRYVDPYAISGMFWFPPEKEIDPYVMDVEEMRNLLDGAWTIASGRHAARYILALFGGIRPYEIDSPKSYLNLTSGIFFVDIKRKTGCRDVKLPYNARLMLQILKCEGRLNADELTPGSNCFRIRKTHKGTLTYFHARLGYRVGEHVVKRQSQSAERFWELNPVKYEAGWIQDGPRHTCLDYYYYATDHDAGSTAGYAGHLQTQFFRNYKGKIRTDNIAAAVAQFYRLMPEPHRRLETATLASGDLVIPLPPWYRIKDDSALAKEILDMAKKLANLDLVNYNATAGRKVKPLNCFELVEHSWRVHYSDGKEELRSKILHKKAEVAALARKHNVVAPDQVITFPIEAATLNYVNGHRIEITQWRVEGRIMRDGKRVWLRPVRTNKEDALQLRNELNVQYGLESGPGLEGQ